MCVFVCLTYLLTYRGHRQFLAISRGPGLPSSPHSSRFPAVPSLSQCFFSASPPASARPASLPDPCGFHLRPWRVALFGGFLRVWPIQDHILLRICLEIGSCPAPSHNTSFLSLSDHLIPNILLRHVLRNVCSRLCTFPVVFHVSQP